MFTEILVKLAKIPKAYKANPNCQTFEAHPIVVKLKAYIKIENQRILWLPKRVTSFPEKYIIVSCPRGIANKIVPSCPLLRCKAALISGIRLAQEEKHNPALK